MYMQWCVLYFSLIFSQCPGVCWAVVCLRGRGAQELTTGNKGQQPGVHTHTYEGRCKHTTYSVLAIKTESICACFPQQCSARRRGRSALQLISKEPPIKVSAHA